MKYKTTRKAVLNGYWKVLSVPYCNLQTLLTYKPPVAYTTRREGWGADIYEVSGSVAIATGYAPFGQKVPYELTRKYELMAREVMDKHYGSEAMAMLNLLIDEFVKEAI